jgi:hypothetical protein
MFVRASLVVGAAVALLSVCPGSATAASTTEFVNRSVFDATPERTAASLRVDGPTAGPLGGAMDVTVRAVDGTLPTTFGSCEAVRVAAQVTLQPGRTISVLTRGEACAHIVDGSLTVNAGFKARNATYEGFGRCRPKLVGEGLIAAAHSQLGGQASFSASYRRGLVHR